MLLRILKSFGMKDVEAVVDAYVCDGDFKKNNILFSFGKEIEIG